MSKANISQSPEVVLANALAQGYVGVHFEQGVPLLDRDLNLLGDLINATTRRILEQFIGNGVIDNGAFRIELDPVILQNKSLFGSTSPVPADTAALVGAAKNDFLINGPGEAMLGGILVKSSGRIKYSEQTGVPPLTTPTAETATFDLGINNLKYRLDLVYLHLILVDEDGAGDTGLLNTHDVGVRTSVRKKATWKVLVKEGLDPSVMTTPAEWRSLKDRYQEGQNAFIDISKPFLPLALVVRLPDEPWVGRVNDVRQEHTTLVQLANRVAAIETALGPSIDTFQPKAAGKWMKVSIKGKNLDIGTTQVYFDKKYALVDSKTATRTQLDVYVPADLGHAPVEVKVVTSLGVAIAEEKFTPLSAPAFASSGQFNPQSGRPGDMITLSGNGFMPPNATVRVYFSGIEATDVTISSDTSMSVKVPALSPGNYYNITVSHDGGSVTSNETFTVTQPSAPAFAQPEFSPTSGPADSDVTLYGSGFDGNNLNVSLYLLDLDGIPQPAGGAMVTSIPPGGETLEIRVPGVPPGSYYINVATDSGTAMSLNMFTVT
jgi:hypothetical protein